jgi:hypothetical protein
LTAVACLILAACSPGADYPSLFPSVHDTPPPRADTPLDSHQVQQATEDLISARDHLSAEAQGAKDKNATSPGPNSGAKTPAKSSAKSSAKSTAKSAAKPSAGNAATGPAAVRKQPGTPVRAQQTFGMDADQPTDIETK